MHSKLSRAHDVVAVHLLQDAPVFKEPVKRLVTRPYGTLHSKVLCWVAVVVGALDLSGVPHVAIVSLKALAQLKTVQ